MKTYIYGLDLSIVNTGVAIFDGENLVKTMSIPTKPSMKTGKRLELIYNKLIEIRNEYPPEIVCMERAFSRFNKATGTIYRVHGIANMVFCENPQIYIPPAKVKSAVLNGKASKEDIKKILDERFKKIEIQNTDESDAVSIVLAYFKEKGEYDEQ